MLNSPRSRLAILAEVAGRAFPALLTGAGRQNIDTNAVFVDTTGLDLEFLSIQLRVFADTINFRNKSSAAS